MSANRRIDQKTGLPLNRDKTVTLYHATQTFLVPRILAEGILRPDKESRVYLTTAKTGTGYGGKNSTTLAVNVDPDILKIDDEFPDGRKDFSIETGPKGLAFKITPL